MVAGRKQIAFDSRPLDRWEIYVADVANGSLENWSQISPAYFDLTGPAMESGSTFRPTKRAERVSIVVPPPAEMRFYSPKMSMGSIRRSLSMGRQYILQATTTNRR